MGCGDVRLLRTIEGIECTGQERAALNKLTMPARVILVQIEETIWERGLDLRGYWS